MAEDFRSDLESLINRHSKENGSNTPDFILAEYLVSCLLAFDTAAHKRDQWYDDPKSPSLEPSVAPDKKRIVYGEAHASDAETQSVEDNTDTIGVGDKVVLTDEIIGWEIGTKAVVRGIEVDGMYEIRLILPTPTLFAYRGQLSLDRTVSSASSRPETMPHDSLKDALQEIFDMTNGDEPESYVNDDRLGCLDSVFHVAQKALGLADK